MDFIILLRGLIMGFSIAAPVGPIGVLCIRKTLTEGKLHGFASGMGAATADAMYGAVAAFGISLVTDLLIAQQFWLRLLGGTFLVYQGVKTATSKPAEKAAEEGRGSLFVSYVSTFLLSITSPLNIMVYTVMFAGLGIVGSGMSAGFALVTGVFLGSAFWWFILSVTVGLLRSRFNQSWLVWVNRCSGVVLAGFGSVIILSII